MEFENINLVPRATCDPARDGPRSHEVTLEGTGMFCHLIGWRDNKRFLLIIMIMQPSQLQRTLNDLKK